MFTPAEDFTAGACRIRTTHRYPGLPVVGFIVTDRAGRLRAHVHVERGLPLAAARRAADRYARGTPTRRDELFATWTSGPRARRPDWLAFVGRCPVVARCRLRDHFLVFDRRTGFPSWFYYDKRPPLRPRPQPVVATAAPALRLAA